MPGLDPSALRRLNTAVVLRAVAETDAPLTMAALVTATSLSRRTIEQILSELLDQGWVDAVEADPDRAEVGRPPRLFAFRAENALIVAVRIDTFAATAMVTDVRGTVLGRSNAPLRDYLNPLAAAEDAMAVIRVAIERSGVPADRVRAGAVAAGGTIDERGVVRRLIHMPQWAGFELADTMTRLSGVPFLADNDANLAALAEHWRGAAKDQASFIWSILGNRVGLGIVIRGQVHRGVEGAAGELVEARMFNFDRLEQQRFAQLTSPIEDERLAALLLVNRAEQGDRQALELLDEFIGEIMIVVEALAWTIAPPLIVLGGGLEVAAGLLLPRLRAAIVDAGLPEMTVLASTIGAEAPLLGGIRFVLDRFDADLFGPTVLQ